MGQVAEHLREQPAGEPGWNCVPVHRAGGGRRRCSARPRARPRRRRGARGRAGGWLVVLADVGERAAVTAQREPRVESVGRVERAEELADGIGLTSRSRSRAKPGPAGGRRRSAPAARAGTGRRGRARGRASRCTDQAPRSVSTSTPGSSSRSGCERAPAASGRPRSGRLPGTPLWRAISTRRAWAASGSSAIALKCGEVGMGPELAARALDDRPGLAAVVGVRVRADEQAHVLEAQADLVERALELCERARLVRPVSTSTIPSPVAIAHALQCGTPGHGSGRRRRQTPGSTRSPRPTSRGRVGLRMGQDGNVPAWPRASSRPLRRPC